MNNKKPKEPKPPKAGPATLLSGMKDRLPEDVRLWDHLEELLRGLAKGYGYQHLETPVLEDLSLYARIQDPTDFYGGNLITFDDADETTVALRPDLLLGLARSYREHGFVNQPQPLKAYATGPSFRFVARPGSGTYRQFLQSCFSVFGDAQPVVDAQLISAFYFLFQELGLTVRLRLNSIGHPECRAQYEKLLLDHYRTRRSVLCEQCKLWLSEKQPLRLFLCKVPECQQLAQEAPPIIDNLCEPDRQHFVQVLEHLDEVEVSYELDPRLFRSPILQNRTVVEFDVQRNGQSFSLVTGGRFDGLVQLSGGEFTPVFSLSAGFERMILVCKEQAIVLPEVQQPDVFLAQLGEAARRKSLRLFLELRRQNIRVSESLSKEGIKGQLEMAARTRAKFALILGQKEIMDGTALIRDMENGIQEVVDFQKVIPELKKRLEKSQPNQVVIPPSEPPVLPLPTSP